MMIAERRPTYAGFGTRELYGRSAGPTTMLLQGFGHSVAVDLAGFGQADPFGLGPRLSQLDKFVTDITTRHATGAQDYLRVARSGDPLIMAELDTGKPVP